MNNESNIMAVAMSQIKLPEMTELIVSNSKYVRYGDDNHFDVFLEDLRTHAPLHSAIITSKINQAYAKGLERETESLNMRLFDAHCNSDEGINSVYKKALTDLIIFGGFYLELIFDNGGHLNSIYHLPFTTIRSGRKNPETHRIEEYFYCEDWFKVYTIGYSAIKVFDPSNRTGRQIFAYKEYSPFRNYYPLPDYVSALEYIAMEKEVGNYGLSLLRNQFSANTVINFRNGIPDEEKQQQIKQRLQDQLTGTDNAGKLVVTFSPSADTSPEINTLQTPDSADQYIQLQNTILQEVLSAHRVVSPLLCGIRTDGNGLGNNANEIETAHQLFYNSVIKPYQDKVVEVLNSLIMMISNYDGSKYEPTTISPVTFTFSEATLAQILTTDEMRQMVGYEPIQQTSDSND